MTTDAHISKLLEAYRVATADHKRLKTQAALQAKYAATIAYNAAVNTYWTNKATVLAVVFKIAKNKS